MIPIRLAAMVKSLQFYVTLPATDAGIKKLVSSVFPCCCWNLIYSWFLTKRQYIWIISVVQCVKFFQSLPVDILRRGALNSLLEILCKVVKCSSFSQNVFDPLVNCSPYLEVHMQHLSDIAVVHVIEVNSSLQLDCIVFPSFQLDQITCIITISWFF